MNLEDLKTATLKCLMLHNKRYAKASIKSTSPVSGGYSRLTYLLEVECENAIESMILQYLPKGATGLVRVDRNIESDLLQHLSTLENIEAPQLITYDMDNTCFDSAALIFKAEAGKPFVEVCRDADQDNLGQLNKVVARAAAQVQSINIDNLPASLVRPTSWSNYLDKQIEMFREAEAESQASRPFLRYLAQWLEENRPPEAPLSLVHGDLQVSNMIDRNNHEAVFVDWELAHIGDPREDLGWFTMVCGAIPPDILTPDVNGFYDEYRAKTGLSEEVINPATTAYFLIISSIRTHYGMMKSSDALIESAEQAQSALAAYYLNITTYQHMNWMNSISVVEAYKGERA